MLSISGSRYPGREKGNSTGNASTTCVWTGSLTDGECFFMIFSSFQATHRCQVRTQYCAAFPRDCHGIWPGEPGFLAQSYSSFGASSLIYRAHAHVSTATIYGYNLYVYIYYIVIVYQYIVIVRCNSHLATPLRQSLFFPRLPCPPCVNTNSTPKDRLTVTS
jgi:hypothetical protein